MAALLLLVFTAVQVTSAFGDWWLSYWSSNPALHPISLWLAVYLGSSVSVALLLLLRAISFALLGVRAASRLHEQLAMRARLSERSPASSADRSG